MSLYCPVGCLPRVGINDRYYTYAIRVQFNSLSLTPREESVSGFVVYIDMTVSLNQRQYIILAEKREAFETAKRTGIYTGLHPEWKRKFAVVYGELFGLTARALNYQCGQCLLGALKQLQPLMVEFENRQAQEAQAVADVTTAPQVNDPVSDAAPALDNQDQEDQLKELEEQEKQGQEHILAIVAKASEQNNTTPNASKESRANRLINQSRNRHRRH